MNSLVIKGIREIDSMKFHHIEGGFGKGKKSMLVKEIAEIHNRELKDINRNINNNIKRFKKGIDILDLKVGGLKSLSLELGYTNQSYANANNIYILSERGYSKLLKILEDDFAWEEYEKLVDRYFNMRMTIKENNISMIKQQEIEARLNNSKARKANILLKLADKSELTKEYKQLLYSYASAIIADKPLIPLPISEEKTYSAGEVGTQLGVSANKIGRIAKENNLKTEQYGKWFHDKSRYSNKEVESFRYFESVIPIIKSILEV